MGKLFVISLPPRGGFEKPHGLAAMGLVRP